jgi:hypothetical protein
MEVFKAQADRLKRRDLEEEGRERSEDAVGLATEVHLALCLAR